MLGGVHVGMVAVLPELGGRKPWGGHISWAEEQAWDTCYVFRQRWYLLTPCFPSVFYLPTWWQHSRACPGAWWGMGLVTPQWWNQKMHISTLLQHRLLRWSRPLSPVINRRPFIYHCRSYNMISVRLVYLCILRLYLLIFPYPHYTWVSRPCIFSKQLCC